MSRRGIFLCTCDQKINTSVDVDAVEKAIQKPFFISRAIQQTSDAEKTVFSHVVQMPHICLPDDLRELRTAIVEKAIERVVVAACSARFQEKNLRDACVEAGVNPNHFALVDWREGCAWAHRRDQEGATAKAIDLVQMGIARVETARTLEGILTKITPRVLVVGGGIAGMTAASALAERDIDVTLIEQEKHLGGQLRHLALDGAMSTYNSTLDAVSHHPKITLQLNARVVAVRGSVGNYHVRIQRASSVDLVEIEAGAIIVATGTQEYRGGRLYRHDGRRVVTQGEFERQFMPGSNTLPPTNLVYVLCAGSCDIHSFYCSNVCCVTALRKVLRLKRLDPNMEITILFRNLNLLGDESNEEILHDAQHLGVHFIQYTPMNPPHVDEDAVKVRDASTGLTQLIPYDRVVLATPLVPRDDAGMIAHLLNLERDEDGFFIDPHQRLRPEQQTERGIFVCGAAHRPVDFDTAIMQGMTAAARAARFIQSREIMRPTTSAHVNEQLCTGCAQCVKSCAVHAIEMTPNSHSPALPHSTIDPFLCVACGNCIVACPSKAIDMPNPSDTQVFAQIEAALNDGARPSSVSSHLVFACQWSGFAAMELAGAHRMEYSANARVIELPCSARLDPLHVLYAFLHGADRVLLALCPPNECHFGNGNNSAEARIENLRTQLGAHGIDPQRVQVARMLGDDAGAWVKALASPTIKSR